MKRGWVLVGLLATVGCKDKARDAPKPSPVVKGDTEVATPVDRAPAKIEGPAVSPVITSSITFFVPKTATWWGEMAFSCYAAAIKLQAGANPAEAFTKVSPMIEPALAIADIDLNKDMQAIGLFGCGDGACAYMALTLRDPEKLGTMLSSIIPGTEAKSVGKLNWTLAAPGGASGPRTIHVQAVPIQWPAKTPGDIWSRDAARATHVVFLSGLFGKGTELDDALIVAADAQTASAKVADLESLVGGTSGRCVFGEVGKRDFQPGYQLDRARFAMVAPEGKGDHLTSLLGSLRTLDLEIDLVLSPAATEAKVAAWIDEARAWVRTTMEPVRAQLAAQGPIVDVIYEVGGLLGKSGFRQTLKDKSLLLSFKTDRITAAELATVEIKLEQAMKNMGYTP